MFLNSDLRQSAVRVRFFFRLASESRFLCLLLPCARWDCQRRQREICDLNLGLGVVYCWVYSSTIAFSSLLCRWQLEGWKHLCPNEFFFFVLSCLPQTHGHLAYAVCSLCRNCQRANKAHGHAWAKQGWWLGIESIHRSLGQTCRANCFFDWTDCRNSRSCHVYIEKRSVAIYKFPFNALHHPKRIPYRLWDFKNSN